MSRDQRETLKHRQQPSKHFVSSLKHLSESNAAASTMTWTSLFNYFMILDKVLSLNMIAWRFNVDMQIERYRMLYYWEVDSRTPSPCRACDTHFQGSNLMTQQCLRCHFQLITFLAVSCATLFDASLSTDYIPCFQLCYTADRVMVLSVGEVCN